jgi:hypothetical protein
MPNTPLRSLATPALNSLCRQQVAQAGQRYTPGIDPDAPNLSVGAMQIAMSAIGCGSKAKERFDSVLEALSEAWTGCKQYSQRVDAIDSAISNARASLAPTLSRIRACDASAAYEWAEQVGRILSLLSEDLAYWRAEESRQEAQRNTTASENVRSTIQSKIYSVNRCAAVVRQETEFIGSAAFKVHYQPLLLIRGEWGTGKTHLVCDVTLSRLERGQATLLVLAKSFEGQILSEIVGRIDPAASLGELLDCLEEISAIQDERVLVFVDGINEGRRTEWRSAIETLANLVATKPGIGLVVTCRTPFESLSMNEDVLAKFHAISHSGFEDQEFDAQAEFFRYYDLPLPEVPLLDREFSRPLTLKLICQSLHNLTARKVAKGFAGIASGQIGMTFVLESFINRVGEEIEREFGLTPKACWNLLKGNDGASTPRRAGFAPCMAAKLRDYITLSEARQIVATNATGLSPKRRNEFLDTLRTSGLIDEDVIWYSSKSGVRSRIVYRLAYQRFSDHLIARHLLKVHLDTESPETIRASFRGAAPLAKIFRGRGRLAHRFAEPGLAQALICEFPTRVGSKLPPTERELYFALPQAVRKLGAYFEPFIEGLFWRNPASFNDGTNALLSQYLSGSETTWQATIDALVSVSAKPKHPYDATRLYRFLERYSMAHRDLRWSEYLRNPWASPAIRRLITWGEQLDVAKTSEESARQLIALFSLVLTTVNRSDRDLATKALVLLGERFPRMLFQHVRTSLAFNDPYVPERVLAAAYGVTLSLVDAEFDGFRDLLGELASFLHLSMFASNAAHATHHTLTRDYALGIIEVAERVGCISLTVAAKRDLSVPYPNIPSAFAGDGKPDDEVSNAIGDAIQMDFGNYTIGSLIPDRANYDHKHPEYVRVRAKIERRIFDLGYRFEAFESADHSIGRVSWNASDASKVDRFGKKYAWIAFFEMWGERQAAGTLPDWRLDERNPDCGVDPSFPRRPPKWSAPIPDMFGALEANTDAWVEGGFTPDWQPLLCVPEVNRHPGDWVLLDGFVQDVDEATDREIFAFLRGLLVSKRDLARLRSAFLGSEYPGNFAIPPAGTEHYLYAGEAGRRRNFAKHLLQTSGTYRRQTAEAFVEHEPVPSDPIADLPRLEVVGVSAEGRTTTRERLHLGPLTPMRRIPGVRVEIPVISFGWESHHSVHNSFSGFSLPAPSLIQKLELATRHREVDFYDSDGRRASLYREASGARIDQRFRLRYMRSDLLSKYLSQTRQLLVWCIWGERDWHSKRESVGWSLPPSRQRICESHRHIHKAFIEWHLRSGQLVRA